VAHEHRRASLLARELADQAVDELSAPGIQLARGLVCEEQFRPVRERGAHRNPLLLAARELRRPACSLVREADALEQFVGAPLTRRTVGAREPELQPDKLACREVRVEGA
jgi:hypothetical protein